MATAVEEVLALWRECERVRDELPADSVVRRLVTADELELRRIYRRLTTERIVETEMTLRATRRTIEAARATLADAHRRLENTVGTETSPSVR
jgi:hypothetical protein